MKIKRLLSILLVISMLATILVACDKEEKSKKSSINPDLVEIFGEDFISEQEKDIAKVVGELEECYAKYQKSNDIDAFCNDIAKGKDMRHDYLEEISKEIGNMQSESLSENDMERYTKLLSLYNDSVAYLQYSTVWYFHQTIINSGLESQYTDTEVKTSLINYINAISEFFYCKKIA